ncbi:MAG TPA: hypothetical protein VGF82_08075 [Terracidiphilus sp.]
MNDDEFARLLGLTLKVNGSVPIEEQESDKSDDDEDDDEAADEGIAS